MLRIRTVKWTGLEQPLNGDRLSYGDFKECDSQGMNPKDYYITPDEMSGSNYSGTLIHKSNFDVFLKQYKKYAGIHEVWGGFSTFAVVIRADALNRHPDIKELLDGLEDYSVLDDEDYSNKEQEAYDEAWKDYYEHDVIVSIQDVLKDDDWEPTEKEFPDGLRYAFDMLLEVTQEEWQIETGGSAWVRVDKPALAIAERILLNKTPDKDLPLLMDRNWSLEITRQDFLKRLELA